MQSSIHLVRSRLADIRNSVFMGIRVATYHIADGFLSHQLFHPTRHKETGWPSWPVPDVQAPPELDRLIVYRYHKSSAPEADVL